MEESRLNLVDHNDDSATDNDMKELNLDSVTEVIRL
jgi:hypothetical protein